MKGIHTLIKLHQRNLDALRRSMGLLENQKAQLQELLVNIRKDLEKEMLLAMEQPDMAHFYGDFAARIRRRQEEVGEEIKDLDRKIAKLNEEIVAEFTELKKFEIARDNAKKRAQEEQARKETLALDEIASQQHHRKVNGNS